MFDFLNERNKIGGVLMKKVHQNCLSQQCNHPLDPVEYECGYDTIIDCDECKYGGGRKNPEAKCNQLK